MTVEPTPRDTAPEAHGPHLGRAALNLVRDVLMAIAIGVVLFVLWRLTFQQILVQGPSMEPSYFNGQRVLVNTLAYRMGTPQRGDVVVFRFKFRQDEEPFIKRIVGLPGEEVDIRDGRVYINNTPLDEPWLTRPAVYSRPKVKLGLDEYYVLGDNRANSSDSHIWGAQPANLIIGRAWVTIWPPANWPVLGRWLSRDQGQRQLRPGA